MMIKSDEMKNKKHSETMKVALAKPSAKLRQSIASKERWRNPETRRRMSEAMKRAWSTTEARTQRSISMKEGWKAPGAKQRLSDAILRYFRTPGARQKLSDALRRSPKKAAQLAQLRRAARPSGSELRLRSWITESGADYLVGDDGHKIGPYFPDVYLPALGLVIECDGYWHSRNQEHYRKRDEYMTGLGLTILRIPSGEIDNGSAKNKIIAAIRGA